MKNKFALPPLPGQSRQGRPSSGALRHLPQGEGFLFCNLFYHIFRKCGILKCRLFIRSIAHETHGLGRQQPGQPRVFGIKLLTTKDGRYTNAIYGFQNILLNLLAAHKPDAVAIAWDERAPTFRHNAYDGYKATRHGMPEELAQQMPVLKELLTDLGFVQVSKGKLGGRRYFKARWPPPVRLRAVQRCWRPATGTVCN